jgi:DNA-binding HxlR family transcriptional regulator/putative sterol carrier protein
VSEHRSYGDPCGIARALDRVGERWALLVVRELLLGPKRFTDLRAGLPGASPNVLSQRLRELEEAGVVRRTRLGPPAASRVYELSEWGRGLEPILLDLGRWGARAPAVRGGELSVDAFLVALKSAFDPRAARGFHATCDLAIKDDHASVEVRGERLKVARGRAERPDITVEADVSTLRGLVFGDRSVVDALRTGAAHVEGDRQAFLRLLTLFQGPAPLPGA